MKQNTGLSLKLSLPVRVANGGFFLSRGHGCHETRTINSHEIIFVVEGWLGMFEDHHSFEVNAGEALILHPGHVHGGTATYPRNLKFFWLHFYLNETEFGLEELDLPQHVSVHRPARLTELFRRFLHDQENGSLTPPLGELILLQIVCELARDPDCPSESGASRLANLANRYIIQHATEPLSTATIARSLACNPDYLNRTFRNHYNTTITQALHSRRLLHAMNLLLNTNSNVDEIATACGFGSARHFRQVFKAAQGMPPLTYRKLHAAMHVNTA